MTSDNSSANCSTVSETAPVVLAVDLDAAEPSTPAPASETAAVTVRTEHLDGRQRRIIAQLEIPHPIEQVWEILTDYDHLADFIPNLAQSRRIEHPDGGIRLEQIGSESVLKIKVYLRVVLDMVERFPHELQFTMIEGDFRTFTGAWELEPIAAGAGTYLRYVVTVLPPRAIPVGLIERNLRHNLANNLLAIRERANALFGAIAQS
jgi:uncharacterized protein YndB with AHSA1/START domain